MANPLPDPAMLHAPSVLADPAADRLQRDLAAWGLLAAVLLLGGLAGPFFAGRVYTGDDLGAFHLPARAFYARQLERGEPFDWTPGLYAGFYLSGEGQAGTYHPVHWLLYRFLPLRAALAWEYLLSYPFMLAGTYLLLRRRLGRRDAAVFGALVFTFSGFNLLHFVHPNAIAVVAHVPWLLWAIDVTFTAPGRRARAAAAATVALLTGSQLLLGYPQYVWFSLLAEGAYTLWLSLSRRESFSPAACGGSTPGTSARAKRPLAGQGEMREGTGLWLRVIGSPWARLAAAMAVGLMIGAVQLLPSMDALNGSARRGTDAAFTNSGSLHPANLIQPIAPYLLSCRVAGENTHEEGLYFGAAPLMLLVWLWTRRNDLGDLRRPAAAVAGFGAVALLLALGQYGGVYRLQRFLPLVGSFRFPCRYVVLVYLSVAALSAMALMLLVARGRRSVGHVSNVPGTMQSCPTSKTPWPQLRPLWQVAAASGVLAAAGLALQGRPTIGPADGVLAGPLLIGTAALLVALAARGSRGALVGLVLFTAMDLGVYGLSYAVYRGTFRLDQYVAATLTPPPGTGGRVVADLARVDQPGLRSGNQMLLAGWCRADGYAGLQPARRLDYHALAALRVAGVRWVRRCPATEAIKGLHPYDDNWLEVPDALPRAWLVTRAQPSDDPARDIARLPLRTTALVDAPLVPELPRGTPGESAVADERPGRIEVRTECPTRQLLVVSESYHPGWQLRLDGRAQEHGVLRADGDFLGCVVPPGRHDVVLEFRPESLRDGAMISCVGLGLVALCFAGVLVRGRSENGKRNSTLETAP